MRSIESVNDNRVPPSVVGHGWPAANSASFKFKIAWVCGDCWHDSGLQKWTSLWVLGYVVNLFSE